MDCCKQKTIAEQRKNIDPQNSFTCPMHPEIVQENAGMCPECGMNLVPTHNKKVPDQKNHKGHANIYKRKFWVSLLLTIPILLYSSMLHDIFGIELPDFPASNIIPPVLGTIVFFYGGWLFIESAWREIRGKMPGMMTLISMAILAAYSYSMGVMLFGLGEETLFWELASLITIMLLGHWLEMKAVKSAQGALKELSKLLPDFAEVIDPAKEGALIKKVSIEALRVGDVVLVRPGGRVPADGLIVDGASTLNEAAITGESNPVDKSEGDAVVAGTINGDGSLKIKVEKIGEETFLAGVARLIAESQASKSRLQILSDRAALYLTFVAVTVGAATFISWTVLGAGIATATTRLVTVLIIACPHALGLAVPLVASISTTKAAQNGFLVKQRIALESARNIDIVLFDKTGTLTHGEFAVSEVVAKDNTKSFVLTMAASLNNQSEHPLAKAIVHEAEIKNLQVKDIKDFERIPGKGVRGNVNGKKVFLGNDALMKDIRVSVPQGIESEEKTVVHLAVEGKFAGSIYLSDMIRDESRRAVARLHNRGIETAMITGDSENVAKWVAKELGMNKYFSEVLPHQKSEKVKALQKKGFRVAMVGDGINDAPALAQADLGIAIGAGTNVAIESAGIILIKDNPEDILKIIRLSSITYRKMIQNLWWAAGYNIVAIPAAAGALVWAGIMLQPAVGAVLMSLSTIIVAFNALLFKKEDL